MSDGPRGATVTLLFVDIAGSTRMLAELGDAYGAVLREYRELMGAAADAAVSALEAEIQPIDDVRSTADYRRLVAGRVLRRLIREEGGW